MAKTSTQPKVPVWTQEKADKAAREGKYVRVGAYIGDGGAIKLSGAPKFWGGAGDRAPLPDLVYVPEARAVGSRADLTAGLPTSFKTAISNGYTMSNTMSGNNARYNNEISASAPSKSAAKKPRDDAATLSALSSAAAGSEAAADAALGNAKQSKKEPGAAKAPRAKAPSHLLERLQKLAAGKVLDVSGMTAEGTKVNAINAPGPKSKKFGAPGLRIVSDSAANFDAAVRMLGTEYKGFIGRHNTGAVVVAVAASTSPRTSPRKSPPTIPRASSPGRR